MAYQAGLGSYFDFVLSARQKAKDSRAYKGQASKFQSMKNARSSAWTLLNFSERGSKLGWRHGSEVRVSAAFPDYQSTGFKHPVQVAHNP